MIVNRHTPIDLFVLLPELRLEMDPELTQLDGLLEDDELFGQVKADLCQRYPNSATLGGHSTPVEVIPRMFLVRRLYYFSYEDIGRLGATMRPAERSRDPAFLSQQDRPGLSIPANGW